MHKKCLEEPLLVYERPYWYYQSLLCSAKLPQMHSPRAGFLLTCLSLFLPVLPKMGFERQRHWICCDLHVHVLSKREGELCNGLRSYIWITPGWPGTVALHKFLLSRDGILGNEGIFNFLLPAGPGNCKSIFFPLKLSGICHFRKNTSQLSSQAWILSY